VQNQGNSDETFHTADKKMRKKNKLQQNLCKIATFTFPTSFSKSSFLPSLSRSSDPTDSFSLAACKRDNQGGIEVE
jgi:hypothetical protein